MARIIRLLWELGCCAWTKIGEAHGTASPSAGAAANHASGTCPTNPVRTSADALRPHGAEKLNATPDTCIDPFWGAPIFLLLYLSALAVFPTFYHTLELASRGAVAPYKQLLERRGARV